MNAKNNSVQNQGHKQHVIVNMLFQKVIYGNIVNKVINGNIVNMMLKIIEHPIYKIGPIVCKHYPRGIFFKNKPGIPDDSLQYLPYLFNKAIIEPTDLSKHC